MGVNVIISDLFKKSFFLSEISRCLHSWLKIQVSKLLRESFNSGISLKMLWSLLRNYFNHTLPIWVTNHIFITLYCVLLYQKRWNKRDLARFFVHGQFGHAMATVSCSILYPISHLFWVNNSPSSKFHPEKMGFDKPVIRL